MDEDGSFDELTKNIGPSKEIASSQLLPIYVCTLLSVLLKLG